MSYVITSYLLMTGLWIMHHLINSNSAHSNFARQIFSSLRGRSRRSRRDESCPDNPQHCGRLCSLSHSQVATQNIYILLSDLSLMTLPRSVLAIIAVVTVETPVSCMERHRQYYPPAYLLYSESVSHLLLLTNSSVNFLIYCVVATR